MLPGTARADRPVIGINTTYERDGRHPVSAVNADYWRAIVNAGGLPLLLPQLDDSELIDQILDRLDGVVLIGGYDIPAERFGARGLPSCVTIEPERERADFALIEALLRLSKPALAICLGFQELNVQLGGSLIQDIPFDGPRSEIRHYSKSGETVHHPVGVEAESRLARALGATGEVRVNSSHHQAIDRLGGGLRAVATAADGIIEAVEVADHPFFIGVQWHPERMGDSAEQQGLFSSLVAATRPAAGVGR